MPRPHRKIPLVAFDHVKRAIAQRRQLTLGEQLMAGEVLDALRHNAREVLGETALPSPDDDLRTSRLKKRGLYEIDYLNDDNHDAEKKAVIDALIEESLRDFVAHESHNRGIPPQLMAIERAKSEAAAGGKAAIEIAGLTEQQTQDRAEIHARVDKLEAAVSDTQQGVAQILALIKGHAASPAPTSSAPAIALPSAPATTASTPPAKPPDTKSDDIAKKGP